MKPRCFSCHTTMKVVYVRVDQICVKIKDYYHCNKCNRTKQVAKENILLSNIIANYGVTIISPNSIKFSLNLRVHQYKLDIWVNDRKEDILEMCQMYILAQVGAHEFRPSISQNLWGLEFKSGKVRIYLTEQGHVMYRKSTGPVIISSR